MGQRTPLHATQVAANGKIVDFHGWDMAVQFAGIAAEHLVVRTACGVFDLGHMGRLTMTGAGALPFLSRHVCRRLDDMKPGQVRYGLVLAEDGTVEDDVLVSRESETSWHIVVNASNKDKILGLWRPVVPAGVVLKDISEVQTMVAVQGPKAGDLLTGLGLDARHLRYYSFVDLPWQGDTIRLSRTGYTGEDGFECFLPSGLAEGLWLAVVTAGAVPCGLGARDTLRTEAGMPLYGHELDRTTTPVEAGLTFALNRQGGYIGAERIQAQLAQGPERRLVGLVVPSKRVPRNGYAIVIEGKPAGIITSGTLGYTVGKAIGMAYVPATSAAVGTRIGIDLRGTVVEAEVTEMPFYRRPKAQ